MTAPRSVAEIEGFVALLAAACNDSKMMADAVAEKAYEVIHKCRR